MFLDFESYVLVVSLTLVINLWLKTIFSAGGLHITPEDCLNLGIRQNFENGKMQKFGHKSEHIITRALSTVTKTVYMVKVTLKVNFTNLKIHT